MSLFRDVRASAITESNGDLLGEISVAKKTAKNPKIQSVLNDCSYIISLLNQGNIEESEQLKKKLRESDYYSRPFANTIFDASKTIYQLISRTLDALPLEQKNRQYTEISEEGYLTPRSP